jgi:electron transport complex protein RnfE
MAVATGFVLICANSLISLIRPLLKPHLRILVFTLTIATFVTVVDRLLAAYLYEMSKQLGPYVPLIIVNCLIISRCEICASKQNIRTALADAFGMSLGFGLGLVSIAIPRELLGSGSLFGLQVLPESWPGWGILALPPGAFLALGLLVATVEWWGNRTKPGGAL